MGEKVDNQSQAVIGVDIGGTNIKIALVEPRRQELLETVRFKTLVNRGPDAVLADLSAHLTELSRQAEKDGFVLRGVGVGCAGLMDLARWDSDHLTQSSWLGEFPVGQEVERGAQSPGFY